MDISYEYNLLSTTQRKNVKKTLELLLSINNIYMHANNIGGWYIDTDKIPKNKYSINKETILFVMEMAIVIVKTDYKINNSKNFITDFFKNN